MSFSRRASINVVPLLSRLVLAAAFIPAGWDKMLGEPMTFTGEDAQILHRLGVGTTNPTAQAAGGVTQGVLGAFQEVEPEPEPEAEPVIEPIATGRLRDRIRPRTDDPTGRIDPGPAAPKPPPPKPPKPAPIVKPPPEVNPPPPPVVKDPEPVQNFGGSTIIAKPLYRVAITLVADNKWPEAWKPQWMAWAAAGAELIGGGLILVGLGSRIWALGLVITMGFAFYLTSLGMVAPYLGQWPPVMPMADFNQVFTQLGLLVLAIGVMLTGAGRFSVDGLLFRDDDEADDHLLHLG